MDFGVGLQRLRCRDGESRFSHSEWSGSSRLKEEQNYSVRVKIKILTILQNNQQRMKFTHFRILQRFWQKTW